MTNFYTNLQWDRRGHLEHTLINGNFFTVNRNVVSKFLDCPGRAIEVGKFNLRQKLYNNEVYSIMLLKVIIP